MLAFSNERTVVRIREGDGRLGWLAILVGGKTDLLKIGG